MRRHKSYKMLVGALILLQVTYTAACSEPRPVRSIAFSPSSFTFSAQEGQDNPPSQTLDVSNSGGGTLEWSLSSGASSLTLSPTSGTSTGETDTITASVDIQGMSAGNYATTIMISAPGASNTPQTVPVNLHIAPAPLATETGIYSNEEWGFSLEYPKGWQVIEELLEGTVIFTSSLAEGSTVIIVIAEELPAFPEPVLEDYVEMTESQMESELTDYGKVSQYSTTVAGEAAIVYTVTWSLGTQAGKHTQAIFLKDRVAYRVSYAGTPESYDEDIDCFELVINSFKFD